MDPYKLHSVLGNRTRIGHVARLRVAGLTAGLIIAALAANPAWALPSCPIFPGGTIQKCCVADQPGGIYKLGQDIAPTKTATCIKISAPRVLLASGYNITGNGAGIGIHVLSTAPNVVITDGASISDFSIGIKTDAPNTLLANVVTESNTRGIIVNGPGAFVVQSEAVDNAHNGIVLTPAASGSFLVSVESAANGGNGVVLNRTTGVSLQNVLALQNVGYGLWLKGASANSVVGGRLEGNTIAGAYLGCHRDFPSNAACSIPPSNNNSFDGYIGVPLTVGSCPGGTQASQPYGIAIDKGNGRNKILRVVTDTNSSCSTPGDTLYDGYDGNGANCRGNFWVGNQLTIENHAYSINHIACME